MAEKSLVAAVRTTPQTVLQDYARLMDLAKYQDVVDRNATTILKNNISWHLFYPSANSTPWQVEGVVKKMRGDGYSDLVIAENRTVVTKAKKGEFLNNFTPVHEKYGLNVKNNFNPHDMRWVTYEPKGPMLCLDEIFPDGIRIPDYFFGKNVVHLPTLKTHIYTDYTCAMKNAFGALLDKSRHYCHPRIHETLVDLLRIQKEIQASTFAVADGTTAGSGPGPRTMTPVVKNLLLASEDQVAIDAVCAKLLGFDPMDVDCIRLATENGLGNGHLDDIHIVGDMDIAEVRKTNWEFVVGDNAASAVGQSQNSSFRLQSSTASSGAASSSTTTSGTPAKVGRRSSAGWKTQSGESSFSNTETPSRRRVACAASFPALPAKHTLLRRVHERPHIEPALRGEPCSAVLPRWPQPARVP